MNKSWREAITSITVLGLVYEVASLLENEISTDLVQRIPFIGSHILLSYILLLTCIFFMILGHIAIQNKLDEQPGSYKWSAGKIALEVISSLFAAMSAIIGNDVLSEIKPLVLLIKAHQPESLIVLAILLSILVAGVPITRGVARYYSGLEDPRRLLNQLDNTYAKHLEYYRLARDTQFPLAVQAQSDGVKPLQARGEPSVPLDGSTEDKVWHYFNLSGQQLLILADPGGGKSTQLYLLGSHLVKAAFIALESVTLQSTPSFWKRVLKVPPFWQGHILNDGFPPLPLILDLSTWPINKWEIEDWLVSEIRRIFEIRRKTALNWIRDRKIIPLLDALDVMDVVDRASCVLKINTYVASNSSRPMVVCCRQNEYENTLFKGHTRIQLNLRQAVFMPRLQQAQVYTILGQISSSYRRDTGDPKAQATAEIIDELIRRMKDAQVQGVMEALQTPLLLSLSIMNLLNYSSVQIQQIVRDNTADQNGIAGIESILFDGYVRTMLQRNGHPDDLIAPTEEVLSWLGYEMRRNKKQDQLTFYISDLQWEWLPTQKAQIHYSWLVARIGFMLRVVIGIILGSAMAYVISKVYGLGGGQVFGGAFDSVPGVVGRVVFGLIGGLGVGLGIAEVIDAARKITLSQKEPESDHQSLWQRLFDRLIHSHRGTRQTLIVALLVGMLASMISGFAGGFGSSMPEKVISILIIGIGVGLTVGILVGPEGILLSTWRNNQHPEGPLRNALRLAIRTFLFYTLIGVFGGGVFVGSIFFSVAVQSLPVDKAITVGLQAFVDGAILGGVGIGMSLGLNLALGNGGADVLQHILLRKELGRIFVLNRGLVKFLDFASTNTLLTREGGGYSFIVKSEKLRDYFADKFVTTYLPEIVAKHPTPRSAMPKRDSRFVKILKSIWKMINFDLRERASVRKDLPDDI